MASKAKPKLSSADIKNLRRIMKKVRAIKIAGLKKAHAVKIKASK